MTIAKTVNTGIKHSGIEHSDMIQIEVSLITLNTSIAMAEDDIQIFSSPVPFRLIGELIL